MYFVFIFCIGPENQILYSTELAWSSALIIINNIQAFKVLPADSCMSDVETRMKFQKTDKYSWFQSIKWMEKSNYNTFWHSAEPWLSLSISWDENNKLECESFCSIFTYVWALSCNFCLIYNSQDDNNTRRTWIGSGCFKSLEVTKTFFIALCGISCISYTMYQ